MSSLYNLKITQLRDINKRIGLSNRRSIDENARQIINHMKNVYHFDGPYTPSAVMSMIDNGVSQSITDHVPLETSKVSSKIIQSCVINPINIGDSESNLPCIIDTLYLNNLINLQYIDDTSSTSSESNSVPEVFVFSETEEESQQSNTLLLSESIEEEDDTADEDEHADDEDEMTDDE